MRLLLAMGFVLACSVQADAQGLGQLDGSFGSVGSPPGYRQVPTIGGFQGNQVYVPLTPPPSVPQSSYVPYSVQPAYQSSEPNMARIQQMMRHP